MTTPPPGRQRYLNWPRREEMRQQVLKEQAAALKEAGERLAAEASTRDAPERGYPKPRRRRPGQPAS